MFLKRWFEAALRAQVFCLLKMYLNQLHKQSFLNIIGF